MTKQAHKKAVTTFDDSQLSDAEVLMRADKARKIFKDAYPDGKNTTMQRKDIIKKMIDETGVTAAGAATYLQNMRMKN